MPLNKLIPVVALVAASAWSAELPGVKDRLRSQLPGCSIGRETQSCTMSTGVITREDGGCSVHCKETQTPQCSHGSFDLDCNYTVSSCLCK